MSKKTFRTESGGIGSLLGESLTKAGTLQKLSSKVKSLESKKPSKGRPRSNYKKVESESERGTLEGETRATFILEKELLEKLKAIAYEERKSIKAIVDNATRRLVETFEKKHGKEYLKHYRQREDR